MTKYFEFRQNNSGGVFTNDAKYVFVAADSCDKANEIAENETFIYFDGCSIGIDCGCCGDRWYQCDEDDFIEAESQDELVEKFWQKHNWIFNNNYVLDMLQKKKHFLWKLDIVVYENNKYTRYNYNGDSE